MDVKLLFIAFFIKHFICDFPLQRWPYMYENKGKWGHFGGVLHSIIHAIGTELILLIFSPGNALLGAMIDYVCHYIIDYTKINICQKYNLKPNNSEWYWHLLGLDQLLHYLTYAGIIWMVK